MTSVNGKLVVSPIRAIGMPHSISPSTNVVVRRARRENASAGTAPTRPPIPTAATMAPTPLSPACSSSSAATTVRTLSAPATSTWAQ